MDRGAWGLNPRGDKESDAMEQLTLPHIQVKQISPPYSTYKSLVCNSSPQKFILKIHFLACHKCTFNLIS